MGVRPSCVRPWATSKTIVSALSTSSLAVPCRS